MRNNDPIFFPGSQVDFDTKQQRDKNYSDSINILQTQWYQADLDQRFAIGDQDLWGILYPNALGSGRRMFNFNLINSFIQMITGQQRRNRKSSIVVPTLPSMQKTADQLTKCLYHLHKDGLYQKYSDCFEQGAVTQGIGLMSFYKDYANDPISGDIKARYVDFKSVLIDPYFRFSDLSDCRYIWTRQFFDKDEAARLYPQFADEILSLPPGEYKDDKFYFMPEVYQLQFPNVIAFDEYWYLSSRECEYIVDIETEEVQEFVGDEEDKREIYRNFKDRLKFITKPKTTTRRTLVVNDKVIVDEPNPYGMDRYPYAACLGYFTPDTPLYAYKFRGIVRDLRDVQYLFTRRKVADLDILEAQQQGLKVKQGALVTPDDALNKGHGRVLSIAKGYEMSDVEAMPIRPPDPTMLQMEEMLRDTMHKIAGIDPAAMGMDMDNEAGIVSMIRQASTTGNLTRLFDQFDRFQTQCGEIQIEMIQKNWTYGKVKQVIGEQPTAEFDNKAFSQYGCKVIQGVLTETQEQLELAQLLKLREIFGDNTPPPVYDRIIKAMYIQNKTELTEEIQEYQKGQAEEAQKMEQLKMQQMEVETRAKEAYSYSQESLGAERSNKIRLDAALSAERLQRADEDRTGSILNLVKAAKELEGMDMDMLERQIDLLANVKESFDDQLETPEQPPIGHVPQPPPSAQIPQENINIEEEQVQL